MCIGIIYDSHTSDYWYRIENDIYSVKSALRGIRLPLPVAGIFDTSRNDFVELDEGYKRYRPELLEKARSIFQKYLQDNRKQTLHQEKPTQILPQSKGKGRPKRNEPGTRSK